MKPIHCIPPALAVIAVSLWLNHSLGELQSTSERIRVLGGKTSTLPDRGTSEAKNSRPNRSIPKNEPKIRWQRIAEIQGQPSKGIFAKLELRRVELLLREMSPEELRAALDEIAALGVDIREQWPMNELVLSAYAAKDPVGLLDHLTNSERTSGMSGNFVFDVFSKWVGTDAAAASAWLDGKIASGTFNSKALSGENQHRMTLEAAMLKALVASDTQAAIARIAALPEAQRERIITQFNVPAEVGKRGFPDPALTNYGALVRATLPSGQQTSAISAPVRSLAAQPGYGHVDGYLDEVSATPGERDSSVGATASTKFRYLVEGNRLNVEELDKFRAWATTQSPERADGIMASALAQLGDNGSSAGAKAYDLAIHYHGTTGNDQILVNFMRWNTSYGREKMLSLAERIKDPAVRNKAVEQLKGNPFMNP